MYYIKGYALKLYKGCKRYGCPLKNENIASYLMTGRVDLPGFCLDVPDCVVY